MFSSFQNWGGLTGFKQIIYATKALRNFVSQSEFTYNLSAVEGLSFFQINSDALKKPGRTATHLVDVGRH